MSGTPRPSRAPSRSRTPSRRPSGSSTPHSGVSAASGSSFIPPMPPLRAQASLASISVYGSRGTSPAPPLPTQEIKVDESSGILLADPDSESESIVEEDPINVSGTTIPPEQADERAKKALREQLRNTLLSRSTSLDPSARLSASRTWTRQNSLSADVQEVAVDSFPPRQYFVLTDAGKPVFIHQPDNPDAPDPTATLGVVQALISIFLDDGDRLRSIKSGQTRITFVLRPPLYYVAISAWGEPESVTRAHLEYLHLQILSIVSASQLKRIFERRGNFDLRRLLDGAENLLHSLLARVESDLTMTTSSLQCLKLESTLRMRASECLIPPSSGKVKIRQDILYVILVAQGRVITLARPRKHSIHPSDLHILMNTVHSPSVLNSSANATWLPVCLPKFNAAGFVNAYVHFLGQDDVAASVPPTPALEDGPSSIVPPSAQDTASVASSSASSAPSKLSQGTPSSQDTSPPSIALICISAGGDFDAIRSWASSAASTISTSGLLAALLSHLSTGATEYGVAALGIPGLRHFVYKSRAHVQLTLPRYEEPYDTADGKKRLIGLYQLMHDAIHAKSGQGSGLKLQFIRTEKECVMGWITQPFEMYVAFSPLLPKGAVVNAANSIARWIKREEPRLFLRDAPVF